MFEKPQREQIVRIKIEDRGLRFGPDLGQGASGRYGRVKERSRPIDFDTAMYKIFRINGQQAIQFRGELFNIFNHTNFQALRPK
jgi:hypothetical protein